MLTIEKSECLPSPRPCTPAFIDTLLVWEMKPRNPTSTDIFLFCFVCFYFFVFSKPNAVFFFCCCCCFFFQNQIYCIGSLRLHDWCKTLSDWHAWSFFQTFVLVTFVMWTENKLFSRKGISWKQIDNLITQYEQEKGLLVPILFIYFFSLFGRFFFFFFLFSPK